MKIAKDKYFLKSTSASFDKTSYAVASAMSIELIKYGITVSNNLMAAIASNKPDVALNFCSQILEDYTIGKVNPPLFRNWEQRKYFSFGEIVVQILGYTFQFSGNDLEDPSYMENLLNSISVERIKNIELASEEEAKKKMLALSKSKVSLDRDNLKTLVGLVECFYDEFYNLPPIYSDEVRVSVLVELYVHGHDLYDSLLQLKCKPADVMRFSAVMLNGIDSAKLPSDARYITLPWKARCALLKFLNTFDYEFLFEETGKNRSAWGRFYKHIHLFDQYAFINKFPKIGFVARVSSGFNEESIPRQYHKLLDSMLDEGTVESTESEHLVYRTFASRVQSAVEQKDFVKLQKLFNTGNFNYLFRNLASIANCIDSKNKFEFVEWIRPKIDKVSASVLFSVLGINVDADYRVIDVKGNTLVEEAKYPRFIRDIQDDIKASIKRRWGYSGKVVVEDGLKNSAVPFLSKNSELVRGTKLTVGQSKYLYLFVHWIQGSRRTDLDLSVASFDENWKPNIVYFGSQVNSYITHSGDFTNAPAPNGATEYIRIDLNKIPKNIKYIIPFINVYTGSPFSENLEAYVSFMASDKAEFSINTDHVRYNLTQPANSNIPYIFDVDSEELILVDFNNRLSNGNTIHGEIPTIKKLISATSDKNFISIEMLADILSGSDDKVSLYIKSTVKDSNEIDPNGLSTIFD